jgi:CRP-like cAMP-binding protein
MSVRFNNRLLSALSAECREALIARCVAVALPLKTSLFDAECTPTHAYFLTSGMCSIVTSMHDGDTAEVGVIGHEGLVGGTHLLGPGKNFTNAFIQLDASALKIALPDLRQAFRQSEEIRDRILEFQQEQLVTASQIAGCNRLHGAEQRLARWLLMAQDRAQTEFLGFTHEFLAMMLGSRRTTVTQIAAKLQKDELIEYTRGRVKIINRERLQAAACDCYRITKELHTSLYSGHGHH